MTNGKQRKYFHLLPFVLVVVCWVLLVIYLFRELLFIAQFLTFHRHFHCASLATVKAFVFSKLFSNSTGQRTVWTLKCVSCYANGKMKFNIRSRWNINKYSRTIRRIFLCIIVCAESDGMEKRSKQHINELEETICMPNVSEQQREGAQSANSIFVDIFHSFIHRKY